MPKLQRNIFRGALIMRYYYGTNDSIGNRGRTATAKQIASIIKKDVEVGKWNVYEGGKADTRSAVCRYKRNGFVYHSHLLISGKESEFRELETLIKDYIEVIPRVFN